VQDIAAERGQFQSQDYRALRKKGQTETVLQLLAVLLLAYRAAQNINFPMWFCV
jgi:hypothetical protein